jgi:hypothetical protein
MPRWLRRRNVLLVVAAVGVVWLAAVAWTLLAARSATVAGKAELDRVRSGASTETLLDPATRRSLDRAEADLARARAKLRSPLVSPLRLVPVVGRHLRAADRVVGTARGSAAVASKAVAELHVLSDRPFGAGPERVRALEDLAAIADRADAALGRLDPGSSAHLVSPLGKAVDDLAAERRDARRGLARAARASRTVAAILRGPTPYLLLGANNAEMRAGTGMFLSGATVGFDQGRLDLGDVRPTAELVLPAGSVPVSGDLARNWPWIDSGRDLRSLGFTADLPQSAPLAAANWAKVPGGTTVGGVIVVDVDALRGLLGVVGPVEVDGIRYTADSIRGELLRQQYRRFANDRDARRDQVGAVAKVVFDRIERGHWKLADLATAMVDAVQARHLMVWSADRSAAATFRAIDADGHLGPDSVSTALLNRGAEKLDSFVTTATDLRSTRRAGGRIEVTITYRITNGAPASGPVYLVGPNIAGMVAGEHRGIVVVNLPNGTTAIEVDGMATIVDAADGDTRAVAGEIRLKRGETKVIQVTGLLPKGLDRVVVEPSGRIPRTTWSIDGAALRSARRRTVPVGDAP